MKRLLADDLTLSYVPDAEQRRWRLLIRGRQQLRRDRVRLQSQLEGLLEEAQIKLSSVVSDLLGASGYRILTPLAQGQSDPEKLAELGDDRLKVSRVALADALNGRAHEAHRVLLRLFLERLDLLNRQMQELTVQIGHAMRAHHQTIARLCEVTGIQSEAAQQIVAEMGPAAAAFPSGRHAASWVGICPGEEESAGKSHSSRSPKGNRTMRRLMTQVAWAAVRTKDGHFQGLFHRLVGRLGVKKAIWAVGHRMLRVIWKILHERVRYVEYGPLGLNPKARHRRKQSILRR